MDLSARARVFFIDIDTAEAWEEPAPPSSEVSEAAAGEDPTLSLSFSEDPALIEAIANEAAALEAELTAGLNEAMLAAELEAAAVLEADRAAAEIAAAEAAALDIAAADVAATDASTAATIEAMEAMEEAQLQNEFFAMQSKMLAQSHETSMAIINNMGSGGPDYNNNGWADWSE